VFVLSDLDLGMNNWMSEPFDYPATPWDRGKVLDDAALAKIQKFDRYKDVDGDGIPYRTLPGVRDAKGAYFTRGSGHDEAARYTEKPEEYRKVIDRLTRKWETAKALVPAPEIVGDESAEVGVIAYGSTHWPLVEARDQLRKQGIPTGYLLIKAIPFCDELERFVARYPRVYVVEQNRDGQMADLVRLETGLDAHRVRSVLYYEGLPLDARTILDEILRQEGRTLVPENVPDEPGAREEEVTKDDAPPGIASPATADGPHKRAEQGVSR
jgi:2-oxoglutarate ferredoxin oxidoreductase subunit alpha